MAVVLLYINRKLASLSFNPVTYMQKEGKVLVLNKCGKTKQLFGTIVQQKSSVTYLVKLEPQKRLCHMNHLLHSRVTSIEVSQMLMMYQI